MSSATGADVAILTVTTNGAAHLSAYLDALDALSCRGWTLWVVDNASHDGSAELVARRFPAARVLRNGSNLGFTGACNRALRELLALERPPRFVLFLNDDTEATPGSLEQLLARADDATLVAPRTLLAWRRGALDDSAGDFDWWRGAWRERTLGRPPSPGERAHTVSSANLSCLLVPTAVLRRIGLLDEAFFVYYDDTDFCRRARAAGSRIVLEPAATVIHRKGATLGGQRNPFACYYLARNRPYLVRKHRTRAQFTAFFAYFLATRFLRSGAWLLRGRPDLVRATWRGVLDFARGRMGPGSPPVDLPSATR